jgi:hypothetical protein
MAIIEYIWNVDRAMLNTVFENIVRCVNKCLETGGGHLEHSSSSIGTTTLSWVSTCSTVVEHSQQEGFTECRCQRHVKPQLGGGPGI